MTKIELFYKGVALFCLPSSYLKTTNIQFFLVYLDFKNRQAVHFMPSIFANHSRVANSVLEQMFL